LSVVLDANLLVVLALDDERAPVVEAKMLRVGDRRRDDARSGAASL
jgi:hypothetical protein